MSDAALRATLVGLHRRSTASAFLVLTIAVLIKTVLEVRAAVFEQVDAVCIFEDPAAGNYSCKDLSIHQPGGWIVLSTVLLIVIAAVLVWRLARRSRISDSADA